MREQIEHHGEFYQLDMEMSFATQEDVFEVIEEVIYNTFKEFTDKKIGKYPFERIAYEDAMLKYGTDKPDLRNPLIIQDVTDIFKNIEFNAFKGKIVRVIVLPDANEVSRRFYDSMVDFATTECGAKGLAWVKVNEDKTLQGPIAKFIDDKSKDELLNKTNAKPGSSIFFISDNKEMVQSISGKVRTQLAEKLDLLKKDVFEFCWIVDFPMFELDDEGKVAFSHNPFSMPQGGIESLKTKNPLEILAYQYDIVCNGIELSSRSC